jgi:hypothetical protein
VGVAVDVGVGEVIGRVVSVGPDAVPVLAAAGSSFLAATRSSVRFEKVKSVASAALLAELGSLDSCGIVGGWSAVFGSLAVPDLAVGRMLVILAASTAVACFTGEVDFFAAPATSVAGA